MKLEVKVFECKRPEMCWATMLVARITINGEHMMWPTQEGELVEEWADLNKRREDFNRRLKIAVARLDHLVAADKSSE